jgi:4-amino-4-deoxy-L-arabinose transferase-like glycosyltransferase
MHTYYLVLLAPPMAALTGIGLRALWLEYRSGRRDLLPLALGLCALWQGATLLQTPDWSGAMVPLLLGSEVLALTFLLCCALPGAKARAGGISWSRVGLGLAILGLFVCPTGWALTPVLSVSGDPEVQADPGLLTGFSDAAVPRGGRPGSKRDDDRKLLAFLEAHRGTARYLVAADASQAVAPLIIASGAPAIAVGGFMGSDPIVDVDGLAKLARTGALRFYLLNRPRALAGARPGFGELGAGPWGRGPQSGNTRALDAWVRAHGTAVDPHLWRSSAPQDPYPRSAGREPSSWGRGGALELFELKRSR